MTRRAVAIGVGHYLPERVVPNAEFEKTLDTTSEWIKSRSGIERRHFAAPGQNTSDLAAHAANAALDMAGLNGNDVDAIVVATSTADLTFPSAATMVQAKIGNTKGYAFDIQAVCAGFAFALTNANALIVSGQADRVLVIGAETFSRLLDWDDRGTCVLFGDGAGAIVLKAEEQSGTNEDRGVLTAHLHSDGRYKEKLYVDGGPGSTSTVGHVRMEGREVFRHAVVNIAEAIEEALAATGFTADDIDWFVPHQANKRILDATAKRIGLAPEKVVITVGEQGNTSAASVPLALDAAVKDGRIKRGDLVLLEAMGGGFTWGSALVRW